MSVSSTRTQSRRLTAVPTSLADKPLYAETKSLFDALGQHRFEAFRAMIDEEFDLVDITADGEHVVLRTPSEILAWFRDRYRCYVERGNRCEFDILEYDAVVGSDLAFSTAYFKQAVSGNGERTLRFGAATVVWNLTADGWKASRWHCSIERTDSDTLPSFT